MIATNLLDAGQLAQIDALVAACTAHDGIDHPLHVEGGAAVERARELPVLLEYAAEELVGVLTLQAGAPPEACLLVHPAHRRHGVGRGLLGAAARRCADAAELLLTADPASESGRAL